MLISTNVKRIAVAVTVGLWSLTGSAQSYPNKSVHIVVGYAAGGPTDVVARIFGERLSKRFQQPFVINNVPGANGELAVRQMLDKPADGYTLMWVASSQLIYGPAIQKAPRFDPIKDFSLIAIASGYSYVGVVPSALPVRDMREFVEYARKYPGKLSFASGGVGGANHLAGEWLNSLTGLDLQHVAYKGDASAAADLVSGNVAFGFLAPNVVVPLVKSGRLKALAVAGPGRQHALSDVPTMRESGFDAFTVELFSGLVGRIGTPAEVVSALNEAVADILKDPEVVAKLAALGTYPMSYPPQLFQQTVEQQLKHWRGIVKTANVQQE